MLRVYLCGYSATEAVAIGADCDRDRICFRKLLAHGTPVQPCMGDLMYI